jgi:hypothetical protein
MQLRFLLLPIIGLGVSRGDAILFDLEAAQGQGLGASSRLRASSLTYDPTTGSPITTDFVYTAPNQPGPGSGLTPGGYEFLMSLEFGSFTAGPTNVWTVIPSQSTVNINGGFTPAGLNTFAAAFSGSFASAFTLAQPGGGSNQVSLTGPVSLSLSSTTAGTALLDYFVPNAVLTGASLDSLVFLPNSPVGPSGAVSSTGTNFLSGSLELDFVSGSQANVPEPSTTGFMACALALVFLARRNMRRLSI